MKNVAMTLPLMPRSIMAGHIRLDDVLKENTDDA